MEAQISGMIASYEKGRISRRSLVAALLAMLGTARSARGATFQGRGLNHIALSVTDIARSRDFYRKHFDLEVIRESGGSCFLDLGPHFLALFRGRTPGLHHYCIAIDGFQASSAVESLNAEGLKPRRSGNRVYFDDPDGIEVQVSSVDHNA